MRDQEIVSLWEAYSQICEQESATGPRLTDAYDKPPYSDSPKSKATRKGPKMKGVIRREEVEIAAEYFYEMGLNEDGVNILIEDLGLEGFANFVYNIAEEYYLTEARAGGARIEPVTAKGQKFKSGKPTGKSLERLRAQKAARQETENKASASKPSGMKASLERQSAVAAAARVARAIEILGEDIPQHLLEAGQLRIEHGQASLEELGSLATPPMTKDAIAGRIRRLLAMADKRATELGIADTEAGIPPELLEDSQE